MVCSVMDHGAAPAAVSKLDTGYWHSRRDPSWSELTCLSVSTEAVYRSRTDNHLKYEVLSLPNNLLKVLGPNSHQ